MISRISQLENAPEWRLSFNWPLKYPEIRERIKFWCDGLAEYSYGIRMQPSHNVLALSHILVSPYATRIIWLALVAQKIPEYHDELVSYQPGNFDELTKIETINFALLRQNIRKFLFNINRAKAVHKFTPQRRLIITHNSILRNSARYSAGRFDFKHASNILWEQRAKSEIQGHGEEINLNILVRDLEQIFVKALDEVSKSVRQLAVKKFRQGASFFIQQCQHDLYLMSNLDMPYDEVWLGSAGYYPARLVAIHSKIRGVKTVSFDHGGSTFMTKYPSFCYLVNLSVINKYVLPNQQARNSFFRINNDYFRQKMDMAEIAVGHGDPYYQSVNRNGLQTPKKLIQALYCLTVLRGTIQNQPTLLPDLVALDLQFRLISWMKEADISVKIKPHPGTNLSGLSSHPLSKAAEVLTMPFEDIMSATQFFVFDYAQSTTFWAALCTDKPVILIDAKITEFDEEMKKLLQERCFIIGTDFDERGRCLPSKEQFFAALTEANKTSGCDSRAFQELLT